MISKTFHIAAPPEKVWDVSVDIDGWPKWTPTARGVEWIADTRLEPNAIARLDLRGGPPGVWTVTHYDEGHEFRWVTKAGPGMRVEAGHIIEPDGGGTRVTLTIQAKGPLGSLLSPLIDRMSRRNVEDEAAGLKRYCESVETPAT